MTIDTKTATLDDIREAQHVGDRHGNAPRFCPARNWVSPARASLYLSLSASQVRRIYLRNGLSACRTCGMWH